MGQPLLYKKPHFFCSDPNFPEKYYECDED